MVKMKMKKKMMVSYFREVYLLHKISSFSSQLTSIKQNYLLLGRSLRPKSAS